jgi:FkbM family methyltransferase
MLPFDAESYGAFFEGIVSRPRQAESPPAVWPGLVFDVGAFTGDSLPLLESIGGKEFFCFEPDPITFNLLRANTERTPSVTRFPRAVSDTDGTRTLTRPDHQPLFSTLEENWGEIGRHNPAFRGPKQTSTVQTLKLDTLIKTLGLVPDILKVDVEGHELAVFEGLSHKPNTVTFEWVVERPETSIACLGRLRMLGFTKFGIGKHEALPVVEYANLDFQAVVKKMLYIRCCVPSMQWGNIWCK